MELSLVAHVGGHHQDAVDALVRQPPGEVISQADCGHPGARGGEQPDRGQSDTAGPAGDEDVPALPVAAVHAAGSWVSGLDSAPLGVMLARIAS